MEQFPRKFGNYHLLKPLAQGGMGALYLAVRGDRGLARLLVIKTVLPHLADAEYTRRFRDEAKVVVKLSHGNLIPVFDAGSVDGELYLAMEFVEGRDLRAIWNRCAKKQVAFPVDVAVYIVKELCRGLVYAHSFGDLKLVHRDVSPPNILVSFAGEVKITDFGLASSNLKLEKTAPGIIYGKVAYMSPEQARGESLDGRSDLYAAAIVMWELLTGRQLFPPGKDQPQDLLLRARNPAPIPPSKKAPRVPPALDTICLKALAPDRNDRYSNGDEFRRALSDWLAREAPGTDAHRLESFLYDLFAEDIARERTQRDDLLNQIRRRAKTLPPTDELRQMVERDTDVTEFDPALIESKLMRGEGDVGRRASDQGLPEDDRRKTGDRRRNRPTGEGEDNDQAAGSARPGPTQPQPPAAQPQAQAQAGEVGAEPVGLAMSSKAAIGQIIDRRFRITELIGEGGMGRVYMAEHIELDRRVAIKILHPVYSRMPDLVKRFKREARAASRIGNPHIVEVTDSSNTADGAVYFVMEYLNGLDLGSLIESQGAIDVRRVLRIGVQICHALAAAHAESIIHRDLKPENIFLTEKEGESDFVKVLDFGVARSIEFEQLRKKRLTSPGMAMGTPEYMSPEQAAGRIADERSDIYSVGAILYEAMTGTTPYAGDNFMEVLTKKATIELPPVHELRPDIPPEVSDLIARTMARSPGQRPGSMEALAYELEKCLSGRGHAVASAIGLNANRAVTDPSLADTRSPIQSGVGMRPVAGTPNAFDFDDVEHTDNVRVRRTVPRWALFGAVAIAVVILAGVGTLLYVASGQSSRVIGSTGKSRGQPSMRDTSGNAGAVQAVDAGPVRSVARVVDAGSKTSRPAAQKPDSVATGVAVVRAKNIQRPRNRVARSKKTPPRARKPGAKGPPARKLLTDADRLLNKDGAWRNAKPLYEQVLDKTKSKVQLRKARLGLAKIAIKYEGDWDDAIDHAEWVLENVNSSHTQARRYIAQAYEAQGKPSSALIHYQEILKNNPRDEKTRKRVQKLCDRLNRKCDLPQG